jgi:hypothetical protein
MNKQDIIELILTNGNPTQKYILSRDILNADIKSPAMLDLQEQILSMKEVKKILKNQNSDGWFGIYLHGGTDAMDGAVSRLIALGVEPHHDFMRKAKVALYADEYPTKARRHYPPVYEYHFSRAQTLANLHVNGEVPDELLVKFQKQLIDKFQRGSQIDSLDEVSKEIKQAKYAGSRVYLPDKDFPWVCDFIVLGSSLIWKTKSTENIIITAMENVARLAPIPTIFEYYNKHYVGPICGYDNFDDCDDCCDLPKGRIIFWMNNYNHLCKICDVRQIPYYFRQAEKLAERIFNDTFIPALSEMALKAIESTYGFSGDFETDIYFIVLNILHNANIVF